MSIKPQPARKAIIYARVQKVNKDMLADKSKLAGMDEAPFLDCVLTAIRTTEEGQALVALDTDIEGSKARRSR